MARRGRTTRGGITAEIEKSLKGINFPANKQKLVQQAKSNRASRDVINAIQNLPEDQFKSPTDVAKAWGEERRGESTTSSSGTHRGGITVDIEKALKGMDYPANKNDLVQQAKKNNANRNVLQAIQKLPEDKFNSPTDVAKAWGEERRGT